MEWLPRSGLVLQMVMFTFTHSMNIKNKDLAPSLEVDIEHIFEPFYTKKVMGRSGTGLEISIVSAVVKDHNSHIDIDSTVGKGTQIKIYFPITRETAKEITFETNLEDLKGAGEKILVVDDVSEQREIASRILN